MKITDKLTGTEETARQYSYIEKAKAYVEALTQTLGRRPSCCVTTFGCQMNLTSET